MLEMAHRQYGVLPWAALMAPAIDLAENGFEVSPRLHAMLKAEVHLKKDPTAAAYFYQADGTPLETGHLLRANLVIVDVADFEAGLVLESELVDADDHFLATVNGGLPAGGGFLDLELGPASGHGLPIYFPEEEPEPPEPL
jgi:hypothetical protein